MLRIYGVVVVLLVFVSSNALAQAINPARQYEQKRNTESPADGVWYVYDREGNLSKEEHYKTYRLDGDIKTFYKSGSTKAITPYVDGHRHGLEKTYYESGSLKGENIYEHNNLNGLSKQYYENGALQKAANYTNGQLDGTMKTYYDTGILKQVWNYANGVISGTQINYGPDGLIKSEDNYQNGVLSSHKDYVTDVASLVSAPAPNAASNDAKVESKDVAKPAPAVPATTEKKELTQK